MSVITHFDLSYLKRFSTAKVRKTVAEPNEWPAITGAVKSKSPYTISSDCYSVYGRGRKTLTYLELCQIGGRLEDVLDVGSFVELR